MDDNENSEIYSEVMDDIPTAIWVINEDGSETDYELKDLWNDNLDYWKDIMFLEDIGYSDYEKFSFLTTDTKNAIWEFLENNKQVVLNLSDGIEFDESITYELYTMSIRVNCKSGSEHYIQQSIEDGMEFDDNEFVEISDDLGLESDEFGNELHEIKLQVYCKPGSEQYVIQSIEDGMEFDEQDGEYVELLDSSNSPDILFPINEK